MSTEPGWTGWMLNGFQVWVALWIWSGVVLLHVVWRCMHRPAADPVRPSGPIP